jgi:hypothetical protein
VTHCEAVYSSSALCDFVGQADSFILASLRPAPVAAAPAWWRRDDRGTPEEHAPGETPQNAQNDATHLRRERPGNAPIRTSSNLHGKEGSPVRVRQRGLGSAGNDGFLGLEGQRCMRVWFVGAFRRIREVSGSQGLDRGPTRPVERARRPRAWPQLGIGVLDLSRGPDDVRLLWFADRPVGQVVAEPGSRSRLNTSSSAAYARKPIPGRP